MENGFQTLKQKFKHNRKLTLDCCWCWFSIRYQYDEQYKNVNMIQISYYNWKWTSFRRLVVFFTGCMRKRKLIRICADYFRSEDVWNCLTVTFQSIIKKGKQFVNRVILRVGKEWESLSKETLNWYIEGRENKGRLKTKWINYVKDRLVFRKNWSHIDLCPEDNLTYD